MINKYNMVTAVVLALTTNHAYAVSTDSISDKMKSAADSAVSDSIYSGSTLSGNLSQDLQDRLQKAEDSAATSTLKKATSDKSAVHTALDGATTWNDTIKSQEYADAAVSDGINALKKEITSGALSSTTSSSALPWAGKSFVVRGVSLGEKAYSFTKRTIRDSRGRIRGYINAPYFDQKFTFDSKGSLNGKSVVTVSRAARGDWRYGLSGLMKISAYQDGRITVTYDYKTGITCGKNTFKRTIAYSLTTGSLSMISDRNVKLTNNYCTSDD